MDDYLIIKLQGPMQAWGSHTFEDYRPSNNFPTRSAIVGLLAACLGVDRQDQDKQIALANGLVMAVRQDDFSAGNGAYTSSRIIDFHTVEKARKVDGKENKNPVVSRREYLCDASFTVAMRVSASAACSLDEVKASLDSPVYTPFLGRRSCPISRPLFEASLKASSFADALSQVSPSRGLIYSDVDEGADGQIRLRDVPLHSKRQFGTRSVFIHSGGSHVS